MFTLGIVAGVGTAFSWACSSMIHASLARTLGAHPFMMLRQPLAALILLILCLALGQVQAYEFYPIFLALISGLTGIGIADWCLYESVLRIGLRSALVCNSLAASFTALLGVIFLEEYLGFQGVLGIFIATSGVIAVILSERRNVNSQINQNTPPKYRIIGVCLALTSSFCLALAFMWAKGALNMGVNPLYVTFLRNFAASVLLWIAAIRLHRVRSTWQNIKVHPELIKFFLLGCFFGPVGGIWLSSVALENAPAAVAATLIALQPVALLVVSGVVERRMPSLGSIIGSCVACLGAAILLLR